MARNISTTFSPKEERKLLRNFDIPSSPAHKQRFAQNILKMAGLVKEDGTVDTDKFAQQFMDYGYPVPDNLHDSAKFNIYTEAELLTEKIYPFVHENKEAIEAVFFGSAMETFISDSYTFDN